MGRSRGGLTTKIHAVVDAAGLPIRYDLSPAQLPAGRQGLYRGPRRRGDHPRQTAPEEHPCLLQAVVSTAKPDRTLFQQTQAVPPHRHPLRKARRQLPRHDQTRNRQTPRTRDAAARLRAFARPSSSAHSPLPRPRPPRLYPIAPRNSNCVHLSCGRFIVDFHCSEMSCPFTALIIRQPCSSGFNSSRDSRVQAESRQYCSHCGSRATGKCLIRYAQRLDVLPGEPVCPRCIVTLVLRHLFRKSSSIIDTSLFWVEPLTLSSVGVDVPQARLLCLDARNSLCNLVFTR